MNGLKILELGLKLLVWMIVTGLILSLVRSVIGMIRSLKGKAEGTEEPGFYLITITLFTSLLMIFLGLAIMPWWS